MDRPSLRARPPTPGWSHALVIAACALLLAIFAGAIELWGVFNAERGEAEARITDERTRIEGAARTIVIDALERAFARALPSRQAVLDDPLRFDEGLVFVQDGVQLLPRTLASHPAARSGELEALDAALRAGRAVVAPESTLELIARARNVITARDDEAFVLAVRGYLAHRAHTQLPGSHDVVVTLWVVDALLAHGDADPQLLRAVLRDGSVVSGTHIASLQHALLRARPTLLLDDARWLHDAVVARCVAAHVDVEALAARLRELEQPPLALPLTPPLEPIALPGIVYLRATSSAVGVEGVRLADADAHALVDADLRKRGLLRPGESIAIQATGDQQLVRTTLRADRLTQALAQTRERHQAKRTLLMVTAILSLIVVVAAAAELRRRRRYHALRSGFLAAVSHELRTPLASMRLLVDAMVGRSVDVRASEQLQRLGRDVDGLDFLVENILSFSRLDRGRLELRRQRTSLAEIASEAVARAQLEGAGVTTTVVVDDEAVTEVDPELVGLVIANLVRNAWQHNPLARRQVTVRVSVDHHQRTARVAVSDDGPGVSDEDRAHMFEEFVRGVRPTTRGTGLGLALCRQIARGHGGEVSLAATGPAGSTFVLTVPLS